MSEPPPYPPPPDQPPEGYESVPVAPPPPAYPAPAAYPPAAYPPPPGYASPAYGYPPPQGQYRVSRNVRAIIAAVIVGAVLMASVIAYVFAGYAYASSRISAADDKIFVAVSHQNDLGSVFGSLHSQFQSLGASSVDGKQVRSLSDKFVAASQKAGTTAEGDDAALAVAASNLKDQQWLTVLSRGQLDREATRIAHARKALGDAKTLAADYVLVGQFLQAFSDAFIDLQTMATDAQANDFVGAEGANATLQTHMTKAVQLSHAPGLPSDFQQFVLDLQTYAIDFGKLLEAYFSNNQADFDAALKVVKADLATLKAFSAGSADQVNAEINAFYKPLQDDFNAEMGKATS